MKKLLLRWLCSVIILIVVTHIVPGFRVQGLQAYLLTPVVIGLLNATLGAILKLLALPLRILTLGLFSLVINAAMLMLATRFVDGFSIHGEFFGVVPALIAAFWLAVLNLLARWTIEN